MNPNPRHDLVIVPCTAGKIWARKISMPDSIPACGVYCGNAWLANRRYAEMYGRRWIVLSAKYGFIDPLTPIQDYNESFALGTSTVSADLLRNQAITLAAANKSIVSLGSRFYNEPIRAAFADLDVSLEFPTEGMKPIPATNWLLRQLGGRRKDIPETWEQRQQRVNGARQRQLDREAQQPSFFE